MADDGLTDLRCFDTARLLPYLRPGVVERVDEVLDLILTKRMAQARAEGARDALNAAADVLEKRGHRSAVTRVRQMAAQHEEQP